MFSYNSFSQLVIFLQFTTQLLILAFLAYWMAVIYLKRKGVLEKYNISTFGPILMIETTRGLDLIDKLSYPKRLWRLFGNAGILFSAIGMVFIAALILFSEYSLIKTFFEGSVIQPGQQNELQNILLIPGINDYIPFFWGVIALIVTLVVHELMHAVLARAEDIRLESVGVAMVAVAPIGGFAKIDAKELYGDEFDDPNDPQIDEEAFYMTATIEEIRAYDAYKKALQIHLAAQEAMPVQTIPFVQNQEQTQQEQTQHGQTQQGQTQQEQIQQEQIHQDRIHQEQIQNQKPSRSPSQKTQNESGKAATKMQRSRILSAGIMANFCVAFVAFLLFFQRRFGRHSADWQPANFGN